MRGQARAASSLTRCLVTCKHHLSVALEPAATGLWGTVVWAVDASGKAPAYEYFRDLDDKDAAKMQALFNRLARDGFIKNDEKFKKLYDRNLREFKSFQLRFLGNYTKGRQFLVAVGLRKKQKAHRPRDLDRAERILGEHVSRCKRGIR